MNTKTTLDYITERGCSVKTQKYVIDGNEEYAVGEPHRCAYVNSEEGRANLQADFPEYYKALTMTVWGDSPKVETGDQERSL